MKDRLIIDLCGGTGSWSKPYVEAGYTVCVVDPLDICGTGAVVLQTTVEELEQDNASPFHSLPIQGVLAAPPCTHFAVSGNVWWESKDHDGKTADAVGTVMVCLRLIRRWRPVFWALENPVGRLRRLIPSLGNPRLIFHPSDYGDAYTKKTLLWGEFQVPEKTPVRPVGSATNHFPESKDRAILRAITPPGFAEAFFRSNP